MASGHASVVRQHDGSQTDRRLDLTPDAQLLGAFIADRDSDAFETLVARHGPRVLRVCRQVLGRSHDAEDAFQATFLLLARKAGSIRNGGSVGAWLQGAAHRIAVRSRVNARRRQLCESKAPGRNGDSVEDHVEIQELRRALHEEIDRLPRRLRDPMLLCYLDGRANAEAARLLHCPTSTVKERLSRAREVLRHRLARRGLALSGLLLCLLLGGPATAEEVPPALVRSTVRAVQARRRPWYLGGSAGGPPRAGFIAVSVLVLLTSAVALALALPPPRRGTWLFWLIEAARNACH